MDFSMKKPFSNRGQSALEYLMTYGWGLVVVATIIAALVLIINPGVISKGSVTGFSQNLSVANVKVPSTSTDPIELVVTNISGRSLKLTGVVVKNNGVSINVNSLVDGVLIGSGIWFLPAVQKKITITPNPNWGSSSFNLSVELQALDNDNFQKNSSGSVSGGSGSGTPSGPSCFLSSPQSGYFSGTPPSVPVTITYSNFSGTPSDPTLTGLCGGSDLILSCSGSGSGTCSNACSSFGSSTVIPAVSLDGTTCTGLPYTFNMQYCSDSIRNGNETCDGSDVGGATCADAGCSGGTGQPACNSSCNGFTIGSCTGCGSAAACSITAPSDPLYNSPPANAFTVTATYSDFSGTPGGNVTCPNATTPVFSCASGTCTATCSGSVGGSSSVSATLTYLSENATCTPNPRNFTMQYCGDGLLNGTEACDGGVGSNTCADVIPGSNGTLACNNSTCQFDTSGCTSALHLSSCSPPGGVWTPGETYVLDNNLSSTGTTCLNLTVNPPSDATGVTIDCLNQYKISGLALSGFASAVKLDAPNITIKDCVIEATPTDASAYSITSLDIKVSATDSVVTHSTMRILSAVSFPFTASVVQMGALNARIEGDSTVSTEAANVKGILILNTGNNFSIQNTTINVNRRGIDVVGGGLITSGLIQSNNIHSLGTNPIGIYLTSIPATSLNVLDNTINVENQAAGTAIGIGTLSVYGNTVISGNPITINAACGSNCNATGIQLGNKTWGASLTGNTIVVNATDPLSGNAYGIEIKGTQPNPTINNTIGTASVGNHITVQSNGSTGAAEGIIVYPTVNGSSNNSFIKNTIGVTGSNANAFGIKVVNGTQLLFRENNLCEGGNDNQKGISIDPSGQTGDQTNICNTCTENDSQVICTELSFECPTTCS
jgi:hypothetical protein